MQQIFSQGKFIIGVFILSFYSSLVLSQVHVDSLLNVGVGTNVPGSAQLKIVATDHRALDISNSPSDTFNLYGIYNNLEPVVASSATVMGIRNSTKAIGDGIIYGSFNNTAAEGTGVKYGFFNQTSHGTTATEEMRGIYNYYRPGGTGYTFGLYNYGRISNPLLNNFSGIYNHVLHSSNEMSGIVYGINNIIAPFDSISTYPVYGISSTISNRGDFTKYGMYSFIRRNSSSTEPIYSIYADARSEGGTGSFYSIYSTATTTDSTTGFGIYASVVGDNASNSWAGYFSGNVYSTYGTWQGSDRNLKENIEDFTKGLELIEHLRPVTFNYRNDHTGGVPREKQYGFIAQEMEEFLPELVRDVTVPGEPLYRTETEEVGDEENGIYQVTTTHAVGEEPPSKRKAVNYTALIPILVKAIQEQQEEINSLKAQLEAQKVENENKITSILKRIEDLEKN